METNQDCDSCGKDFKMLERELRSEINAVENIVSAFYVIKISKLENELKKKNEEMNEMMALQGRMKEMNTRLLRTIQTETEKAKSESICSEDQVIKYIMCAFQEPGNTMGNSLLSRLQEIKDMQ